MSLISKPYTFTVGAVIVASQHNADYDVIFSDYNGNIDDTNIASAAAIADTKLAQITTAGKVSSTSITGLIAAASVFPAGMIVLWSGTIATIPSGWVLCNGANSTPDLRNLFVVGANADSGGVAKSTITGSALQSGGSTTITTGNLAASPLTISGSTSNGSGNTCVQFTTNGGSLTTQNTSNLGSGTAYTQPFYALAYIMKT